MELKWTKVEDGLPSSTGWYLTYSPDYWRGNAFTNREKCEGLVFAKFTVSKSGSKGWSIESPMNSGVVKAWMPLPLPEWANPWTDVPFASTPGYPSAKLEDELKRKGKEIHSRPPTVEEVDSGQAQWCWTCGNNECCMSRHDTLMICDSFSERSREDLESDPHFGGNDKEEF